VSAPVASRILRIAGDIFEVSPDALQPESSPDSIPTWDSMRHLNLVLGLEQEFGIQFTPEEIEQLLTMELVAALVEEKLEALESRDECSIPVRGIR
jgi:acyl carrier protein